MLPTNSHCVKATCTACQGSQVTVHCAGLSSSVRTQWREHRELLRKENREMYLGPQRRLSGGRSISGKQYVLEKSYGSYWGYWIFPWILILRFPKMTRRVPRDSKIKLKVKVSWILHSALVGWRGVKQIIVLMVGRRQLNLPSTSKYESHSKLVADVLSTF